MDARRSGGSPPSTSWASSSSPMQAARSSVVYTAGKLMLLKLRRDYKEQKGDDFSLRTFHDTLLAQGAAPFWAHRQLLLGTSSGDLLD